jgi:hypothetical protein
MRAVCIFSAGLALRLTLIARFPLIFGGDPMVRMIHRDSILISHQLPLLQLIVFGLARLTHNYVVTMCAMALIGAAVGTAFYLLARDLVSENTAFWAALLVATNPFLVGYSIVPFQESLMLAALLFAFHFYYADEPIASSLCLALACFTRFEAWAAAPVLAIASGRRQGILRGLALYGWAPAAWLIYQRGLAPAGSFVVESHITVARLMRWVYLGYITVKFTPVIVIALAAAGAWLLWRDRWWPRVWPLVAFLGLFTIALLFSAHGDPPDPERRIASREAHIWIAAVLLLAAIALETIPRYRAAAALAGILFGIWGSYRFVTNEAADPRLQLSYRLAKFFDRTLDPDQRAAILSPPWPPSTFEFYLQRARETGGEAGYAAAVRNLADADMSPPDYQRTLIHSRFDRTRLLPAANQCTEWIAVWSDFASPPRDLPPPQTVLRSGSLSVKISRRTCK